MMKPSCEATMNRSVIDLRELSGRRRGWVVGGVVGEGASDGGGQVFLGRWPGMVGGQPIGDVDADAAGAVKDPP